MTAVEEGLLFWFSGGEGLSEEGSVLISRSGLDQRGRRDKRRGSLGDSVSP